MKEWKTPKVESLDVKKTAHTIKWMKQGGCTGWHKWNFTGWEFCGNNYQPTQEDVIDTPES